MSESMIGIKIADGTFYPIMEEGSSKRKRLVLTTVKDNQESVQIDLYKGTGEEFENAVYVGSLVIDNIATAGRGNPEIELIVGVDAEGTLLADAGDLGSGERQKLSVSLESFDSEGIYDTPDFSLDEDEEGLNLDDNLDLDGELNLDEDLNLDADMSLDEDLNLDEQLDLDDLSSDEDTLDDLFGDLEEDDQEGAPEDSREDIQEDSLDADFVEELDDDFGEDFLKELEDSDFDMSELDEMEFEETEPEDSVFEEPDFEVSELEDSVFEEPEFGESEFGESETEMEETEQEESGQREYGIPGFEDEKPPRRKVCVTLPLVLLLLMIALLLGALAYFLIFTPRGAQVPPLVADGPRVEAPAEAPPAEETPLPEPAVPVPAEAGKTDPPMLIERVIEKERVIVEGVWYRIRRGDTLWGISRSFYNSPWLYGEIAKENDIRNPDLIYAETRIFIPTKSRQ